jgi:hypothetical protein
MEQTILDYGPPPLTEGAADAALDAIDFIAATVRGFDAIDVTDVLRPLWRAHLASLFSHLPPETRMWFANAPVLLIGIRTQWPLMDPMQRAQIVQQWSYELPQMLWMIEPVLAQAHAIEMQESTRAHITNLRQQAQQAGGASSSQAAMDELSRRRQQAASLSNFSTQMANSTMNLMRAMSGH